MAGDSKKPYPGLSYRNDADLKAWLAKRPVMVLDEPTEGLDAVAGRRLMDRLLAASEARTLIAVTHQADAGALFDRVVTVEGSEVHEAR